MNFEASDRIKFATGILAAAILSSGLTLGLYKVGSGLASRAGNAITVTGTASENATADNAVWNLNLNESQATLASSVKKIDASGVLSRKITTEVNTFSSFFPAEENHQKYLKKYPDGYSCHFLRDIYWAL